MLMLFRSYKRVGLIKVTMIKPENSVKQDQAYHGILFNYGERSVLADLVVAVMTAKEIEKMKLNGIKRHRPIDHYHIY